MDKNGPGLNHKYVQAWYHRSYIANQFRIFSNKFIDNPTEEVKNIMNEYAQNLVTAHSEVVSNEPR